MPGQFHEPRKEAESRYGHHGHHPRADREQQHHPLHEGFAAGAAVRFQRPDRAGPDGLWSAFRIRRHSQPPGNQANLPKYGDWPTFPQLWVQGELVGGCDIVTEMYANGELQPLVEAAAAEAAGNETAGQD